MSLVNPARNWETIEALRKTKETDRIIRAAGTGD